MSNPVLRLNTGRPKTFEERMQEELEADLRSRGRLRDPNSIEMRTMTNLNQGPPPMPSMVKGPDGYSYPVNMPKQQNGWVFATGRNNLNPQWHRVGSEIPSDFQVSQEPLMGQKRFTPDFHGHEVPFATQNDNQIREGIWKNYNGNRAVTSPTPMDIDPNEPMPAYMNNRLNRMDRQQLIQQSVNSHHGQFDPNVFSAPKNDPIRGNPLSPPGAAQAKPPLSNASMAPKAGLMQRASSAGKGMMGKFSKFSAKAPSAMTMMMVMGQMQQMQQINKMNADQKESEQRRFDMRI